MNNTRFVHATSCGAIFTLALLAGCAAGGNDGGQDEDGDGADEQDLIVTTLPSDESGNIPRGVDIILTFSEPVAPESVDESIEPDMAYDLSWSADYTVLTIMPAALLSPNVTYTVTLYDLAMADGSELAEPYAFQFTTSGSGVSVAGKMALWTGGTRLRGANVYQRRVYPELDGDEFMGTGTVGPPLTQQDFTNLAAFGANYVNISHPGLYSETAPYVLDEAIQDNLDRLLEMVTQADLFAVITFRTGPGRSEFAIFWGQDTQTDPEGGWFDPSYYNNAVWTDGGAQDAWAQMWRYTANRYKDNPIVVGYDLMCEPNPEEIFFDIWQEPTAFYPAQAGTLYDWNQFYPDVVAAIREVDPDTPVLVQPMGWGAAVWLPYLKPTEDPYTVYTIHQYEPSSYTHQPADSLEISYPGSADLDWDGLDETLDRSRLEDLLVNTVDAFREQYGLPAAVNEFGPQRFEPGAGQYMADLMDLFERRGMNHALWEWSSSWPPQELDNDAFNFRHGPDPDHHAAVSESDLITAILDSWQRNSLRPSNVAYGGDGGR